jgi:hypothetical protein
MRLYLLLPLIHLFTYFAGQPTATESDMARASRAPVCPILSPAHVFHFAFLTGEGTEGVDQASLARLKETTGCLL